MSVNNIHAKDWAEDDWGWYSGMADNPCAQDDAPHNTGDTFEFGPAVNPYAQDETPR